MKFSDDIAGPDFDQADLIIFDFGDTEISFRLPTQHSKLAQILAPQDLTAISDDLWKVEDNGNIRTMQLVQQQWVYENNTGLEDMFSAGLTMILELIPKSDRDKQVPLKSSALSHWIVKTLKDIVLTIDRITADDVQAAESYKEWQVPLSTSELEIIPKPHLNLFKTAWGHIDSGKLTPTIYIPVNELYLIHCNFNLAELVYYETDKRLPEKERLSIERAMLMEFLDHIQIKYSDELLKKIQKLN